MVRTARVCHNPNEDTLRQPALRYSLVVALAIAGAAAPRLVAGDLRARQRVPFQYFQPGH
jgi:hypothetical protein